MELNEKQKEQFKKGLKELSDYITLGDGESYTGIFREMSLKPVERVIFNRPVKSFKIVLEDPEDHQLKTMYMRNRTVLSTIVEKVKAGDIITIFRQGEGRDTLYHIKLAKEVGKKEFEGEEVPVIDPEEIDPKDIPF